MARYTHSSDAKGRIFIPAKLREQLGRELVVTRSLDEGYLAVYTDEQFETVKDQIMSLAGTDPLVRRLRREIVGEAVSCLMDAQGRISVSDELWSEIGVTAGDDVCLIDMGDGLEICSKNFYKKMREENKALSECDFSGYEVKGVF